MESKITKEFCRVFKELESTPEVLNKAVEIMVSESTLWEIGWALKSVDKTTISLIEKFINPIVLEDIKIAMRFIGPVRLKDSEAFQNKILYMLKKKNIEGLKNIYVDDSIEIPKRFNLDITIEEIKEMIANGELDY